MMSYIFYAISIKVEDKLHYPGIGIQKEIEEDFFINYGNFI